MLSFLGGALSVGFARLGSGAAVGGGATERRESTSTLAEAEADVASGMGAAEDGGATEKRESMSTAGEGDGDGEAARAADGDAFCPDGRAAADPPAPKGPLGAEAGPLALNGFDRRRFVVESALDMVLIT